MDKKKGGGPAFAGFVESGSTTSGHPLVYHTGMSLRAYLAANAMQGLCANPDLSRHAFERKYSPACVREDLAVTAVQMADALLKELQK